MIGTIIIIIIIIIISIIILLLSVVVIVVVVVFIIIIIIIIIIIMSYLNKRLQKWNTTKYYFKYLNYCSQGTRADQLRFGRNC